MNESTIYEKLKIFFEPDFLEVLNDSYKHSGHPGEAQIMEILILQ